MKKLIRNKISKVVVWVGTYAEVVENGISVGDMIFGGPELEIVDVPDSLMVAPQKNIYDVEVKDNPNYTSVSESEIIKKLQETVYAKNPDETFLSLDYVNTSLDDLKVKKLEQLDYLCNKTILGTFESSASGESHVYVFDTEAQINLAGVKQAFAEGLIQSIAWATRDAGVVDLNAAQFGRLWLDGFIHKNANIQKYRNLKNQVEAADDKESVLAILW